MLGTKPVSLALLYVLLNVAPTSATEYIDIGLHAGVQAADTVVLARVVDPARALVNVEGVLKGEAPTQITLVAYTDGFAARYSESPSWQRPRSSFF